ncbi:hypothetical protein [Phenylobacterium sp.]|jgi:signal transduction histidine kinase|uniref:hypothetical protein n=1 Tax=Phenylobacterium sp. TaxID=1871053 RepID=UPI0037CC67EB
MQISTYDAAGRGAPSVPLASAEPEVLAIATVAREAAQWRGLNAEDLDRMVSDRLDALDVAGVEAGAVDFLAVLLAEDAVDGVETGGDPTIRLSAHELALVGTVTLEAVENARRYASPPGRALKVWVKIERSDARVRLSIRDNGMGMIDLSPDPMRGRGLIAAIAEHLKGFARLGAAHFGGAMVVLTFTPGAKEA